MKYKFPGLFDISACIFLCVIVLSGNTLASDPGVGWHLSTGEWVINNSSVPTTDPFLHASEHIPWVANQWLADVGFYVLLQHGGWSVLHIIVFGFLLSIYLFVVAPLLRSNDISPSIVFFVTFLSALQGWLQWFLRPVMFSVMLLAVVYSITYRWYDSREHEGKAQRNTSLFFLPLIFLLWVNLHPGFLMGFVVLGFCLLALLFSNRCDKGIRFIKLGIVFVVSLGVTFINPYGLALHKYSFGLLGNEYFMDLMDEWASPHVYESSFWPFWVVVIILLFAVFRGWTRNWSMLDVLLLVSFVCMSLINCRYIPFFGIVSSLPIAKALESFLEQAQGARTHAGRLLAKSFGNIWRRERRSSIGGYAGSLWVVMLLWTIVTGFLPLHMDEQIGMHSKFPKQAADIIAKSRGENDRGTLASAKIFHTPNWGGYLTWRLWPNFKAFIDDRNQLNGKARYEEFFTLYNIKPGWEELLKSHNFDWLLLEKNVPLAVMLEDSSEWKTSFDSDTVLLLRKH